MTERGHVNLHISIRRTWCGKTVARITGTVGPSTVDVKVTGWRRHLVIEEARRTYDATAVHVHATHRRRLQRRTRGHDP